MKKTLILIRKQKFIKNNFIFLGKEVAIFVQNNFINELKKDPAFSDENYKKALENTFFKMDEV